MNKISLPDTMNVDDCNICFVRVSDTMFEARCTNSPFIKGVLCYNGNNYILDTADKDGVAMTFVFTNLERMFKFLVAHKDGNYTNLT